MSHLPTIDILRELGEGNVGNTHNERLALLLLLESDDPVPTGHVAERIGVSKGAMTTIANRLVEKKMIKRVHNDNRRSIFLEATGVARLAAQRATKRAGYDVTS